MLEKLDQPVCLYAKLSSITFTSILAAQNSNTSIHVLMRCNKQWMSSQPRIEPRLPIRNLNDPIHDHQLHRNVKTANQGPDAPDYQ